MQRSISMVTQTHSSITVINIFNENMSFFKFTNHFDLNFFVLSRYRQGWSLEKSAFTEENKQNTQAARDSRDTGARHLQGLASPCQ
jgi:hypothetical protein